MIDLDVSQNSLIFLIPVLLRNEIPPLDFENEKTVESKNTQKHTLKPYKFYLLPRNKT